jgi:hypothetical protein
MTQDYTSFFPDLLVVMTGRLEGILDIQWSHHFANSSLPSVFQESPLHHEWASGRASGWTATDRFWGLTRNRAEATQRLILRAKVLSSCAINS